MTPEQFIAKYADSKGAERANYSMFLTELCYLLDVPSPDAASGGVLGDYQFEGPVKSEVVFGGKGTKRIDLYKRDCFILEAKQSQQDYDVSRDTLTDETVETVTDLFGNIIGTTTARGKRAPRYDRFMAEARVQAERYAHGLPDDHRSPPFLMVVDIGRAFELYFDYGGNGRGYRFYPDQQSYRIPFADLAEEATRDLLRAIWTDPASIDPTRIAADVTRDIAHRLADVGKYLEGEERRRNPEVSHLRTEATALFLMRILFCMFAEDVGLLPDKSFQSLLEDAKDKSENWWRNQLDSLWKAMDSPDHRDRYWLHADSVIQHFNGNLFADRQVFALDSGMIDHLVAAARCNWRSVEPAIFGTLLEQVLNGEDRAKLGAHYTPRAYVQRLVNAVIAEVVDGEWATARAIAESAANDGDNDAALATITAFHQRLCGLRILDPACGTGNFLYVALEYLLRLESSVIELAASLGATITPAVHPNQLLGLELNERAAVIAELVLWIGWLRHRIANQPDSIGDPVLPTLANINFGTHGGYDAVLRRTATGEPDVAQPMIPAWPDADFIIGNPPFIGAKYIREMLGSDYAEALWKANPRVPPSADFVMQWWDRAAHILTASGSGLARFGFVTTNSITQTFSRRVIEQYLAADTSPPFDKLRRGGGPEGVGGVPAIDQAPDGEGVTPPPPLRGGPPPLQGRGPGGGDCPHDATAVTGDSPPTPTLPPEGGRGKLSLILAIPDHPWTKATPDAAAVRIAMTVAARGSHDGRLIEITHESGLETDTPTLLTRETRARINPDLKTGADVTSVVALKANEGLASPGVKLHGAGFIISPREAEDLGLGNRPGLEAHIRPYRNGRDLLQRSRGAMVIDLFGLGEAEVRQRFPEVYQHILAKVKPERDSNHRASYARLWWVHGEPRSEIRPALHDLSKYVATAVTAKHRIFQFLEAQILPDDALIAIGSDDPWILGVLSSDLHVHWSLAVGGTLEDRPRYNKSQIFDPFPFPDAKADQRSAIAALAEELDATRLAALAENERLTMTELYNLRDWVRARRVAAGPSPSPLVGEDQGGGPAASAADKIPADQRGSPSFQPPTRLAPTPPSPQGGGGHPTSISDADMERRARNARAGIVDQLHAQIDAAVADAYGWGDEWRRAPLPPAEIVRRLVALNAARAGEEAAGQIRWLRPDYQIPRFGG